jgi:hypothetical protein
MKEMPEVYTEPPAAILREIQRTSEANIELMFFFKYERKFFSKVIGLGTIP